MYACIILDEAFDPWYRTALAIRAESILEHLPFLRAGPSQWWFVFNRDLKVLRTSWAALWWWLTRLFRQTFETAAVIDQ